MYEHCWSPGNYRVIHDHDFCICVIAKVISKQFRMNTHR
jgi:hypothetical protein